MSLSGEMHTYNWTHIQIKHDPCFNKGVQ